MVWNSLRSILSSLAIVVLVAGCANMNTVKSAPINDAVKRTFSAPYDQTNAAALATLQSMNVAITSSSEDARGTTYLVSKSVNLFSWGEVGRVVVGRSEGDSTTVYINWEKRSKMQISGTSESSFSRAYFTELEKKL